MSDYNRVNVVYSSVAKIIRNILNGYKENRPVIIEDDGYIPGILMDSLKELNDYLVGRGIQEYEEKNYDSAYIALLMIINQLNSSSQISIAGVENLPDDVMFAFEVLCNNLNNILYKGRTNSLPYMELKKRYLETKDKEKALESELVKYKHQTSSLKKQLEDCKQQLEFLKSLNSDLMKYINEDIIADKKAEQINEERKQLKRGKSIVTPKGIYIVQNK